MAYQRFKIPVFSSEPATVATFATLRGANAQTVANVATVAGQEPETENFPPEAVRQAVAETAKPDAEVYADTLQLIGPCGYGPVAVFLGWGATRAANAESELRQAGKIVYDRTGRGTPA